MKFPPVFRPEAAFLNAYKALDFARMYDVMNGLDLHASIIYMQKGDVKSLALHLETNRFDTILCMHGHRFVLCLLEYYLSIEFYEKCGEIVKQIQAHNEMAGDSLVTELSKIKS